MKLDAVDWQTAMMDRHDVAFLVERSDRQAVRKVVRGDRPRVITAYDDGMFRSGQERVAVNGKGELACVAVQRLAEMA